MWSRGAEDFVADETRPSVAPLRSQIVFHRRRPRQSESAREELQAHHDIAVVHEYE
jgi:hypothetical protein